MLTELSRFWHKMNYLLQETLLGLRRGGWLNWAAVSTLMVLLYLVGTSLELSRSLDLSVSSLGNQLEISAYLKPEIKGTTLSKTVEKLPYIHKVEVVPKADAWRTLLIEMGIEDKDAVENQLGQNPLVDALRVQVDQAVHLDEAAMGIQQLPGVDEVYYGSQVVKQLIQLQDSLRLSSLTITGVLTLATVAVITTTIRLVVMARRREIEVMQLVGATAAWIYMPFILQGFLFGLIGGVSAWGLVLGSQQVLADVFGQLVALPFLQQLADPPLAQDWLLPGILLGLGTFLGTMGSLIAVRRSSRG